MAAPAPLPVSGPGGPVPLAAPVPLGGPTGLGLVPLGAPTALGATPAAGGGTRLDPSIFAAASGSAPQKQDFMGWLTDILSRPLRAVTNPIAKGLDDITSIEQGKSGWGDLPKMLGGLALAPAQGVLSTNRNDQNLTSDLIQKTSDAINASQGQPSTPVNGLLAGAAGFVGDVALDPSTYIPGPDIATVGAKLGKIIPGVAESLAKSKNAAADVASTLKDVPTAPPGEAPQLHFPSGAAGDPIPEAPAVAVPTEPAPTQLGSPVGMPSEYKQPAASPLERLTPDAVQHPVMSLPSRLVGAFDRTDKAKSLIDDLSKPSVLKGTDKLSYKPHLPIEKWTAAVAQKFPNRPMAMLGKDNNLLAKDVPKFLKDPFTEPKLRQQALDQIKVGHEEYVDKFRSNPANQLPKTELSAPEVDTMLSRFAHMRSTEQGAARIDEAFGPGVSNRLKRTMNPDRFEQKVKYVNDVLDRNFDLDSVTGPKDLQPIQSDILTHLGIPNPGKTFADMNAARLTRPSRVAEVHAVQDAAKADPVAADVLKKMESPELSAADQEVVKALPSALKREFFERYDHISGTGAERTSTEKGMGIGSYRHIFNQYSQYSVDKALMDNIWPKLTTLQKAGKLAPGLKRAEAAKEAGMEMLGRKDDLFARQGIPLYIGVKDDLLPLSTHQMLSVLHSTDNKTLLQAVWNGKNSIPQTFLADAVNVAHRGGSREDILKALTNTEARNATENGTKKVLTNPLSGDHQIPWGTHGFGANRKTTFINSVDVADRLATAVQRSREGMSRLIEMNAKDYQTRLVSESGELSDKALQRIDQLINDPEALPQALRAIDNAGADIAKTGTMAHATQDAVDLATAKVEGTIEPDLQISAHSAVRADDIYKHSDLHNAFQKMQPTMQRAHDLLGADDSKMYKLAQAAAAAAGDAGAAADKAMAEADGTIADIFDISIRHEMAGNTFIDSLRRAFSPGFQNERTFEIMQAAGALSGLRRELVEQALTKLGRTYGATIGKTNTPELARIWYNWSHGILTGDAHLDQGVSDLENVFGRQWHGPDAILNNPVFRNGNSVEMMQDAIDRSFQGAKYSTDGFVFDLEKAAKDATENNVSPIEAAMAQVKDWDVPDPLDTMHRLYVASERIASEATAVQEFVRYGTRKGLISDTYKPGMVKVDSSGHSIYYKYLPEGKYYDKELLKEFSVTDHLAQLSRNPEGALGNFIMKYFDPIQRTWKYAVTLPRPGHHIRNLVGDLTQTFLANGVKHFMRSSNDAFKVLGQMRQYDGVDINRVADHLGWKELPKGTDVLSDGIFGKINIQTLADEAIRRGLSPTFSKVEDLLSQTVKTPVSKVVDKAFLRGGRIEKSLGTISEYRDHWGRLQHFLQYIYQAQNKAPNGVQSLDDLFSAAAIHTRKWHPNGTSLTAFEAKYMRRGIPFYTWLKGVLPMIVEATMTHPGRIMVIPKASYNLAIAMGVHPDSLSNPFPANKMFPSFLTEQMLGPSLNMGGNLVSMSPGFSSVDVLNQIANPLQSLKSMITPALQIPIDVATGTNMSTGAKITDWPGFVDQNMPDAGYVANATGMSPTASLLSLLQGKGLTQQAALTPNASGQTKKTPFDQQLSDINWLTGLGLVDTTKPSYQRYAQIEKRNATPAAKSTIVNTNGG